MPAEIKTLKRESEFNYQRTKSTTLIHTFGKPDY